MAKRKQQLVDEASTLLACTASLLRRSLNATLWHLEITPMQLLLLEALVDIGSDDEVSQQALADHLGLDKMTVSQVLRSLEALEYVQRRSGHNRRALRVSATRSGRSLVDEARPFTRSAAKDFWEPAGADLASVVAALDRVLDKARRDVADWAAMRPVPMRKRRAE